MSIVTLAVAAVAVAAIGLMLLSSNARATVVVWAATVFLVPPWVAVNVGIEWSALTVVTLVALLLHTRGFRWTLADLGMVAFALLVIALWAMGAVALSSVVVALLSWTVPYVWGRVILQRIPVSFLVNVIALFATFVAALAVIEAMSGVNFFSSIPGTGVEYATWNPLQYRGGLLRAEGAFGHSIALGATLAMCSAFVIATRWNILVRLVMLATVGAGTVLTLSRTGLLTFGLTVAISVFVLSGLTLRNRLLITGLLALAVLVAAPFLIDAFSDASDEAEGSAEYRTDLLVLVSQVRVFGAAPNWESLVVGNYYLGHFARSVDSTVVLTLLRYGIVPSLFALSVVVFAIWSSFRKGALRNPAGIATIAQLPSLFVVSLITQYGAFFWFVTGLAVAWSEQSRSRSPSDLRGTDHDEANDVDQGEYIASDDLDEATDGERDRRSR